ncbi:MAG: hypothetical protein U1G07_00715 [Verrucomicrobiota bacterium]
MAPPLRRKNYSRRVVYITNAAGHKLLLPATPLADYNWFNRYPVILYLHGAAARGNDNKEPLNWGPRLLLGQNSAQHPFFLVVPQSPRESGWLQWNWTGSGAPKETPALASAVELIEKDLPKRFGIDPARRYITGARFDGRARRLGGDGRPTRVLCCRRACLRRADAHGDDASGPSIPVSGLSIQTTITWSRSRRRGAGRAWRAHGGTREGGEAYLASNSSWKRAYIDPELLEQLFAQKRN